MGKMDNVQNRFVRLGRIILRFYGTVGYSIVRQESATYYVPSMYVTYLPTTAALIFSSQDMRMLHSYGI